MNLNDLFGTGENLTPLQMGVRAFLMFFIALVLIRFGGMRIFGKKTAFDNILVIMLGAILARGVVGASPFFATVVAGAVLVVIHKILALLSLKYIWIGKIVKGIHRSLYKNDELNRRNMRISTISKDDLMEGVRLQINSNDIKDVKEAFIEKNGQVSIVKK
ncbi:MAG TPA: YetF domain-containing protein [Chitinophagaceae bacterium]|nr:YetF domain-containing protein [Chitinophagaceae bacterium]